MEFQLPRRMIERPTPKDVQCNRTTFGKRPHQRCSDHEKICPVVAPPEGMIIEVLVSIECRDLSSGVREVEPRMIEPGRYVVGKLYGYTGFYSTFHLTHFLELYPVVNGEKKKEPSRVLVEIDGHYEKDDGRSKHVDWSGVKMITTKHVETVEEI